MHQKRAKGKLPVVLSKEDLTALDKGIRSAKTEPTYTLEESIQFARNRRKEWMRKPPKAKQ